MGEVIWMVRFAWLLVLNQSDVTKPTKPIYWFLSSYLPLEMINLCLCCWVFMASWNAG